MTWVLLMVAVGLGSGQTSMDHIGFATHEACEAAAEKAVTALKQAAISDLGRPVARVAWVCAETGAKPTS